MLPDLDILAILAQSKDATAIYDSPELHIRFVNNTMLKIWGKDKHIVGKTFEEALPELEGQPFTGLLKNVWKTGKTYIAVDTPATLIIEGQPKTSYFDFEYRAIIDESGATWAILHTATDVTSRVLAWRKVEQKKRREEQLIVELSQTNADVRAANDNLSEINRDLITSNENINQLNLRLQESETDFKRLVEQAPVAIMVFRGKDLVIDLANQAMLEILHKDASVIGMPLLAGLPELKGEPAVELLFDVFNTGRSSDGVEVPVRIMGNNGLETRYFNFSYQPLRDGRRIVGVMDVAVEVTAQVMARKDLEAILAEKSILEQSLRANEQRLQGILDTMAEGVVIIGADYKLTYVNPMAQRIMGIKEYNFLGRTYGDSRWENERLDGTPLPKEDHPMYIAMRTGMAVFDQEIAVKIPGSEKIYISINAAPIIDDNEQVTGGIVTFTDVTNRRKVLQEKDDFISVASHELKTPIASLKGSLQLLDRILPNIKPEMLEKLVRQAIKSLNKLTDLVNGLLNSNRVSQGRFPIHKTKFKLTDLINACCDHVRTSGSHIITLKGNLDLEISADEQLLDQVIVNLVNNAVKYAPNSKEIIIEVERLDEQARISVTDFGPGILPEKLPHIFERYYRADPGGAQFSGLGLGLFICAEIIEKHGGTMGVESEPGHGCKFWFTLPI